MAADALIERTLDTFSIAAGSLVTPTPRAS